MSSALLERDSADHRQEKAHFQTVPGRVHRSGEDRERLHALRARAAGVRARRQSTGTAIDGHTYTHLIYSDIYSVKTNAMPFLI